MLRLYQILNMGRLCAYIFLNRLPTSGLVAFTEQILLMCATKGVILLLSSTWKKEEIYGIYSMSPSLLIQIYFSKIPMSLKHGWEATKAAGMNWVVPFIGNLCGHWKIFRYTSVEALYWQFCKDSLLKATKNC